MTKKRSSPIFLAAFLSLFVLAGAINPQTASVKITGKIISEVTGKPLEYATVVLLELRIKTKSDENGRYEIEIPLSKLPPKPQTYTFIVTAEDLKPLEEKVEIKPDSRTAQNHDFTVSAIHVSGRSLTVRGNRDLQQVSRYTMTSNDIKKVPAGFNDIIRGLTSMPGMTSNGIFGSIIMRGADPDGNYYTIDNIPIMDPRHFLGLHTIISPDVVSDVDVFSSASPANFGYTDAAVISMNTLDEVKKLGLTANIGLISANAIIKGPIESVKNKEKENKGYWFLSGRAGYLSLLFPLFNTLIKSPISQLPEYYDYQAKVKYYFNSKHAIRIFVMGTSDVYIFNPSPSAQAELFKQNAGSDPLNPLSSIVAQYHQGSHSQAIYYEYKPSNSIQNTFMLFTSFNQQVYSMQMTYGGAVADISKDTRPNVFGIKNDFQLQWLNKETQLKLGLEYSYFDFRSSGVDIVPLKPWVPGAGGSVPNFSDPTQYSLRPYNRTAFNHVIGGYLENKFQFGGFTMTPGFRLNYLKINQEVIWDPRLMVSYAFKDGTLLSLAGGKYSQYMQTNMSYFDRNPIIAVTPNYVSEKALHSVIGVEHKFEKFSIKGEVYFNWFYDQSYRYVSPTQVDPTGAPLTYINSGVARNYGFEILLKKFTPKDEQGFFGWISYTFTQAKLQTGVPNESYRNIFINSHREEAHAIKMVAGYRSGSHSISGRLAFNTSFPYTQIAGDDHQILLAGRYGPVYNSIPNTQWYDPVLSLDLRYTFTKIFAWGELSFYIEGINLISLIYNRRDTLKWRYDKPYQPGVNPVLTQSSRALPAIPNFGVEARF